MIDRAIAAMPTVVVGGNAVDVHLKGVVPGRDFPLDRVHDLRNADGRRPLPALRQRRSRSSRDRDRPRLQARHQVFEGDGGDLPRREGERGPRRSWAATGSASTGSSPAAVEAGHDANGIIWPLPLAPYQVVVVPLQVQNAAVMEQAAGTREGARRRPGSTCWSTTATSGPGVKFKDADLIGIPLRVVIGERGLKEGTIEVKWRTEAAAQHRSPRPRPPRRSWPRSRGAAERHEAACQERHRGPRGARGGHEPSRRVSPTGPTSCWAP